MPVKFDFISPGVLLREIDQSVLPPTADVEGPVIIGRTRKGPAMKPVKVRSLDDYLAIFGKPIPGGNSVQGDMWRTGNMAGPTYAAYAAQAWLAGGSSPVTVVRLLGENSPAPSDPGGYAGWQTDKTGPQLSAAENGGAYGLFMCNSSSADKNAVTGALAAVFYVNEGALALSGTAHVMEQATLSNPVSLTTSSCGYFFIGEGSENTFAMSRYNTSGVEQEVIKFNFNRNDALYLRSVFNTNPQLTNSSINNTTTTYWLGESYERHMKTYVTNAAGDDVYAIMLPLDSGSYNWGVNRTGMKAAESGWVFAQDNTSASADFQPQDMQKLFKFVSIHDGEDLQKDIAIAITNLKFPSNPAVDNYSTFSVAILDFWTGETMEKYDLLNLNPASPNYIGMKIGDMWQEWSYSDRRYKMYGDNPVRSDYVRVVVDEDINVAGPSDTTYLPFGFYGPIRPEGFMLTSGSAFNASGKAMHIGRHADFEGAWVQGSGSAFRCMNSPGGLEVWTTGALGYPATSSFVAPMRFDMSASFLFPSIPLRGNGAQGYAPNPYKAYYGIRPVISDTSTMKDPDYPDYVRRNINASIYQLNPNAPADGYEYSFVFTLDDMVINEASGTVTYTSGSRKNLTSWTALSGAASLVTDQNVKQFVMPMFGGFDGLNIKESEPFNNTLFSGNETSNYTVYTLNKAIDTVADPEVVACNIMMTPGIHVAAVTNKLMNTCESRQDALAIIDLANDYTPATENTETSVQRRGSVKSAVGSLKNRNLNSSYACCYYPWVQIVDNLNNSERVWVPSSVAGLGAMASSEARTELWFAPAGFNRGGLGNLGGPAGPRVVQARQRLDSSDRDDLYAVNINPIATFPNEGVVIFGQKTLQVTASALDRINVRRLLIFLKSKVGHISRNLLFDQNIASTWARFKSQVNPLLADVQARFGITEYKLVLDETTTTPDLIDRNIMYAKIFLKPARAIEFIVVDFVITKSGADFA